MQEDHRRNENQKREILEHDADKPLPEETAKQLGCNISDRLPAKLRLMKLLQASYPQLDFLMLQTLVEHYLDHPDDKPEDVTRRAPKDYFDEKKATSKPPIGGMLTDESGEFPHNFMSNDVNRLSTGYESSEKETQEAAAAATTT